MKSRFCLVLIFLFSALAGGAQAQVAGSSSAMWRDVSEPQAAARLSTVQRSTARREIVPVAFRTLSLDRPAMETLLKTAPIEASKTLDHGLEIQLPLPEGGFGRFHVVESPIMEPGLAAQFPEIKTYLIQGIDDPTASGRVDLTPRGLRATVLSAGGRFFIDPYWSNNDSISIAYYTDDFSNMTKLKMLTCGVLGNQTLATNTQSRAAIAERPTGASLRTYRLALAATGEYTAAVSGSNPGTVQKAMAAMVTSVNRVTAVYEREFAIRLVLVNNTNLLIFTNSATDPYTDEDGEAMLTQNQTKIDAVIGNANYDIGHVFSTGGGGVALLGVVCKAGSKAQGVTGSPSPVGDPYDIDYVAHEMGHQFGGNHPFNGTSGNAAGGNRNASTAYEPGSGSTIMAYAGICAPQDLQMHSDDYFHSVNYSEIDTYTASGTGSNAFSTVATGNNPPVIAALPTSTTNIPSQTPFALTASASDANGDALTYCWEEYDKGAAQNPLASPRDNGASPIFRSYNPVTSPTRFFPSLKYILGNANIPPASYSVSGTSLATGETLPTTSRTMTFRVSVRDNRAGGGGQNFASMQVTSVAAAGPFKITSPNSAMNVAAGLPLNVTWNVAGTTAAPINCANVKISFSTDGGYTFPTVLAASTPNNGSASVTIPNISTNATTAGRIKIEAVGNIFFDIDDANFTVSATSAAPAITEFSPSSGVQQTSVVITGSDFGSASAVRFNGTDAVFRIDSATQITARVPATATTGPISVVNSIGTGTSASQFTVFPGPAAPVITSFSPTNGLPGNNVTITGTDFSNVNIVAFNGANASYTVNSNTQITATVPSGATTGPLSVTTTSGTADSAGNFTVLSGNGVPVVNSAATASGTIGMAIAPYQIAASNVPTSFSASNLPNGLSVSSAGVISGTPSVSGTILTTISATNAYGTGSATLTFSLAPASSSATVFSEDFGSITVGNNTTTSGSSTGWGGNDNFPTVVRAYQAGGAVRLGSSSAIGSLTSKALDLSVNGGAFSVKIDVKGWTTVEGTLKVTVSGRPVQTISYTATSADAFETKTLNFTGGTANSTLKIETSAKRAFIDNVAILSAGSPGSTISLTGNATNLAAAYGMAGSSSTALTLSGSNLTTGITVNAPAGFEVSKTAQNGFSSSLIFDPTGSSVASTSVFVRLAAGSDAGSLNGVLSATSSSAISQIALAGSIAKASQTIQFGALPAKTVGDAAFNLNATGGGSGQEISYTSSSPGVASVSGNVVTILHAGQTTITASQPGNNNYLAASSVLQTLTVTDAAPTFSSAFPGYAANDPVGGVPALIAYALGGSSSGNNLGILPQTSVDADGLVITFLARINDAHLAITVEGSVDLVLGWTAAVSKVDGVNQAGVPDGFQRQSWRLSSKGKGFLRVRAQDNP